jgi:predicted nucleic acid-binding protein|tara:strand:- start:91 stop:780 length:690 start_codon:yes stop_codon:yes gene_type:complete
MRAIVFDSGPIITLTTNGLLGLLVELKSRYQGTFYIPEGVKNELVTHPLQTKKFKFEALQILRLLESGHLKMYDAPGLRKKTIHLLDIANRILFARNHPLRVIQFAEMNALAAAIEMKAEALVVDERTTRMLIESPEELARRMRKKLHTKVTIDKKALNEFQKLVEGIKVLRSTELVMVAYEKGLLDKFKLKIDKPRETLLSALLWALKLQGAAISDQEINEVIRIETK